MKKVLIVGYGRQGRIHAQTISLLESIQLVGIVDSFSFENQNFIEIENKYSSEKIACFSQLTLALEKLQPDFVVLATPANVRVSLVKEILKYDAFLLVEKPFSLLETEYQEMIKNFHLKKKCFAVGYVLQYHTAFQIWLKKIVEFFSLEKWNWKINLTQYRSLTQYHSNTISPVVDCISHYTDMVLSILQKKGIDLSCFEAKQLSCYEKKNSTNYQGVVKIVLFPKVIFTFSLKILFVEVQKPSFLTSEIRDDLVSIQFQNKTTISQNLNAHFKHQLSIQSLNKKFSEKIFNLEKTSQVKIYHDQFVSFLKQVERFKNKLQMQNEYELKERLQVKWTENMLKQLK